jgi:hypothetical protein
MPPPWVEGESRGAASIYGRIVAAGVDIAFLNDAYWTTVTEW